MTNALQLNDVGTIFVLTVREEDPADHDATVVVDISAATNLMIHFKKPNGSTISRPAVLNGSGVDGKMKYVTIAGDIDQAGKWRIQAAATIGGWVGKSDIQSFVVRENVT